MAHDTDPKKVAEMKAEIRKIESLLAHKKALLTAECGMERPAGFQSREVPLDTETLERLIGHLLCIHGDTVRAVCTILGEDMADRLVRETRKEQE